MTQSHTQAQLAARAMSPAQGSPSVSGAGYHLPPAKRPRASPVPPSQPGSPYPAPAFAASPGAAPTPPQAVASPAPFLNGVSSPYANGGATAAPVLSLPQTQPHLAAASQPPAMSPQLAASPAAPAISLPTMATPQIATPQMATPTMTAPTPIPIPKATAPASSSIPLPTPAPAHYTNATMAPIMPAPAGTGSPAPMGPPSKPQEKPTKELEYDVTDSLAGTGIDIRAEELFLANTLQYDERRTGFPPYGPGSRASFYGAGPANQPAQPTDGATQREYELLAARRAWEDAAARLARSRAQELNSPFLNIAMLHSRAERIAKANGLSLNVDLKAGADGRSSVGRLRNPADVPQPTVVVSTRVGPDSATIMTYGSWLPPDFNLADQVALLSLATNQRLRNLIGDANVTSRNRQTTSHGEVPEEWQKAAAPLLRQVGSADRGVKSLKRPLDTSTSSATEPAAKQAKVKGTSNTATTLRTVARDVRSWEERRLKRKKVRKDGGTGGPGDVNMAQSRAGSVPPGTPGSVAPDDNTPSKPEKPISKKELKRTQSMKTAEAASHANQNLTSSLFSNLGRAGSLFGKKGKNKTYDWMNAAKSGTGAMTPSRPGSRGGPTSAGGGGAAGALGGAGPGAAGAAMALTVEGRVRMGSWREDGSKGEGIQLRDWVCVLESDGAAVRALQLAYDRLDESTPK